VKTNGHQLIIVSDEAKTVQLVSADGKVRPVQLQRGENTLFVPKNGVYILNRQKIVIR